MDYSPYHEEEEYGCYGESNSSEEEEWVEDPEYFQEDYLEKQSIMDDLALKQHIATLSYITTKFDHEDDYTAIAASEASKRYQAFRSYSSFINTMNQEDPIVNGFFKGDATCAW